MLVNMVDQRLKNDTVSMELDCPFATNTFFFLFTLITKMQNFIKSGVDQLGFWEAQL